MNTALLTISRQIMIKLVGSIPFQNPNMKLIRRLFKDTNSINIVSVLKVTRKFKMGSTSLSNILMPYIEQEIESTINITAPLRLMEERIES